MKSYIIGLLILLFGMLHVTDAFAQVLSVYGEVSDNEGPLPGVSVTIRSNSKTTVTNATGNFNTSVNKNDELVFSLPGYETQTIKVTQGGKMNVTLKIKEVELEDLVVIGYATMKKRDLTGSIISIKESDIMVNTPTDISSALQGKISGLEIISNTGQPGDDAVVRIRGTGTLSANGAGPLYIVDGVETENINNINPRDIASVEVLKDAASAAIYGSKSGNGVIIISTKQGEKGKPRISADYTLKSGRLSHKLPQMNRLEGIEYDIISNYFSGGGFYVASDSLNPGYLFDNDYQDMLFRTAYTHKLDASFSGAADKFSYYFSLGMLDEQGIMLNTYNKRLNSRLNVQYKPTSRLIVGGTYSYSQSDTKTAPWSAKSYLSRPSAYGMKYSDGSYVPTLSSRPNPLAVLDLGKFNTKWYTVQLYNYLNFTILKNLVFRASLANTLNFSLYNEFYPAILSQNRLRSGAQVDGMSTSWVNENTLSYKFSIKKSHNFTNMIGQSLNNRVSNVMRLYVKDNITDATPYPVGFTNVDMSKTNVAITGNKLFSVFGRITYDYKSKYLFNSNIRMDGSTRFGANNRWGYFPSVSAGWRFSDENFMKGFGDVLSDGKIRVSYGIVGNQSVGDFASAAIYSSSYYGDYVGIYPSQLENKDLKWEQNKQLNIGLDLSLFKNRLNIVLDLYKKNSSDVLYNVKLPQTSGFYSSYKNVGDIENKGIELSVTSVNYNSKNFKWSTTFNISKNKNMILSIPDGGRYLTYWVFLIEKGYPIGTMWGYEKKGIFAYDESNAFTPEGVQLSPVFDDRENFIKYQLNGQDYAGDIVNLKYNSNEGEKFKGGDVLWNDINNDGVIDADDQKVIGNGQPDLTGGFLNDFKYKNFNFSVFFNFSIGNDIYNKNKANDNTFGVSSLTRPNPVVLRNSWTAPGDIALYPRPQGGLAGVQNTRYESSMWVEDGSFIRLKSLKLGYKFPESMLKKIKISSANFYVLLQNYFTWTNYTGFDPEIGAGGIFAIGYDGTTYPRSKEIVVGLSVNF